MNKEFPFNIEPVVAGMEQFAAESGTRVVYFFDRLNNLGGGVTVAYSPILKNSKNYPVGTMANVAVAYCKPGDAFSRKVGRELALEALYYGTCIQLPIYGGKHPVRYLRRMFDVLDTQPW